MGRGTEKRKRAELQRIHDESLPFVEQTSRIIQDLMGVVPGTRLAERLSLPWYMPTPADIAKEEVIICADEDAMDIDDKDKMPLCESSISARSDPPLNYGSFRSLNGSVMDAMNAFTVSTLPESSDRSHNNLSGNPMSAMSAFTASALSKPKHESRPTLRQGSTPIPNPFFTQDGPLPANPNLKAVSEGAKPCTKGSLGRLLHFKHLSERTESTAASAAAQSKQLNKALRLAVPTVPEDSQNSILNNARQTLKRKWQQDGSPATDYQQEAGAQDKMTTTQPPNATTSLPQQPLLPVFEPRSNNHPPDLSTLLANGFQPTPENLPIAPPHRPYTPKTSLILTHKILDPKPIFLPSGVTLWNLRNSHHRRTPSSDSDTENSLPKPSNWIPDLDLTLSSHLKNPRVCVEATMLHAVTFSRTGDASHWSQVCCPALGIQPRFIRIVLPVLHPSDPFRDSVHRDWLILELRTLPAAMKRGRAARNALVGYRYLILVFPVCSLVETRTLGKVVEGEARRVSRLVFEGVGRMPLMFGQHRDGEELAVWVEAFMGGKAVVEVEYAEDDVKCWT